VHLLAKSYITIIGLNGCGRFRTH